MMLSKTNCFLSLFIALVVIAPKLTKASTPPDAGYLTNQLEKIIIKNNLPEIIGEKEDTNKLEETNLNALIKVNKFHFEGNKIIHSDQLQALTKNYLGRELTFKELKELAISVANLYRTKGWVVKTYIPEQEVKNETVIIKIIESKFGQIRFEGKKSSRISNTRIKKIIQQQQKKDHSLSSKAIDRGLLIANDTPGISVSGNLTEGKEKNKTDLSLHIEDEKLVKSNFSFDNNGSRSTGSERMIANIKLNSPFGHGELVNLDYMHSQRGEKFKNRGSDYFRLLLSTPFLYNGLRLGISSSYFLYNLISPDFKDLGAKGYAKTVGFESNYPIIRSPKKNLYASINYDHKIFNNKSLSTVNSNYYSDIFTFALSANGVDNYVGGGYNNANFSIIKGKLNLKKSPNFLNDSITTKTNGFFNKFLFTANRQQKITNDISALISLSSQISSKNLDSSEKFYLGGPNGVRAYPSNEGGGTNGSLISLEIKKHFKYNINISGFYDLGKITINKNNNFSQKSDPNKFFLKGAGLSFEWQSQFGMLLKATWSHRIGKNPNSNFIGKDQDGSFIKNRFWISTSLAF